MSSIKSPKEIPKVLDADWAASDKPVLACQDGCVRILDLKLKSGSSPMEEHQLPGTVLVHKIASARHPASDPGRTENETGYLGSSVNPGGTWICSWPLTFA